MQYFYIYRVFFSYERIHQFGKKVVRASKNFKNTGLTIHSRRQKQRAHFLLQSNYKSQNFYPLEERNLQPIIHSIPSTCELLPSSKHPFSTKKSILRKLDSRRDIYFKVTSFFVEKSSKVIFCEGEVLRKKTQMVGRQRVFVKRNDTLYHLENFLSTKKFIKLTDLHYANDYYFVVNSDIFLLDWIM